METTQLHTTGGAAQSKPKPLPRRAGAAGPGDAEGGGMSAPADWAGQTFEPVQFTIPTEADFMAEAAHQYQAMRLLRAVLARDDKQLSATAAAEPQAHLELVDWFDGFAADLEANAKRLRQASARLLVGLSRAETAGR